MSVLRWLFNVWWCRKVHSGSCKGSLKWVRNGWIVIRRQQPSYPNSSHTSQTKPSNPTLRANPFPKVTDLFCRLPLPTFFYRLEAVHLGDLMRLWVRPSMTRHKQALGFSRIVNRAPNTFKSQRLRCFPSSTTISPVNLFPWCWTYTCVHIHC